MDDKGLVTITEEEYKELLDTQRFYGCLESMGVDCWEGYDEAVDMYRENKDD